jgi:hypothetical protein
MKKLTKNDLSGLGKLQGSAYYKEERLTKEERDIIEDCEFPFLYLIEEFMSVSDVIIKLLKYRLEHKESVTHILNLTRELINAIKPVLETIETDINKMTITLPEDWWLSPEKRKERAKLRALLEAP